MIFIEPPIYSKNSKDIIVYPQNMFSASGSWDIHKNAYKMEFSATEWMYNGKEEV